MEAGTSRFFKLSVVQHKRTAKDRTGTKIEAVDETGPKKNNVFEGLTSSECFSRGIIQVFTFYYEIIFNNCHVLLTLSGTII